MISIKKYVITIIALVVLAAGSLFGGIRLGQKGYTYNGKNFQIINQNSAPHDVDYNLLWNVLGTLNSKYIDAPIDQQKVLYGAISGAVAAVGDPYTTFFDPQSYNDFKTQLSGSFEGIGAEIGMQNGKIIIVSPLPGSPAKQAGLLPGDQLLKINDQDATNYTLEQTVDKIRGPKGTQVKITIFRVKDAKQYDFTITRQTITVKSVIYSTVKDGNKQIELININEFGDDTVSLFQQAVKDAEDKKVSGIILDLRDDPGGYLDDAIQIGSYWVEPGNVIVTEARSSGTSTPTNTPYNAKGNAVLHSMPTVVLINAGSASAAEILSGALHDYGLAKLVGVKSFGKGSVQELVDLPGGTALKVTVAKWLTPKGQNLNHNGLDPDITVALTSDQIIKNQDPQMDKALELLK